MRIKKVFNKKLEGGEEGVSVAGGINAAVAANVNEPGPTSTSVKTRQRIVQKNGKTVIHESETREEEGS